MNGATAARDIITIIDEFSAALGDDKIVMLVNPADLWVGDKVDGFTVQLVVSAVPGSTPVTVVKWAESDLPASYPPGVRVVLEAPAEP